MSRGGTGDEMERNFYGAPCEDHCRTLMDPHHQPSCFFFFVELDMVAETTVVLQQEKTLPPLRLPGFYFLMHRNI